MSFFSKNKSDSRKKEKNYSPNSKSSISKIKTNRLSKIGRAVFWTFFIFLILRGIGSLFPTDETISAQDIIADYKESRIYKDRVEFEATSFAESFTSEFMTYESEDMNDYRNRLSSFLPAYLSDLGVRFQDNTKAQVIESNAYDIEWVSDNQLNIKVWLKVNYELQEKIEKEDGSFDINTITKLNTINLKVPVAEKEGLYVIEDYPAFISNIDKAETEYKWHSGYTADKKKTEEIKTILNSFFKVYYSGSSEEISYYIEGSMRIKGLEDRIKYIELGNVSVYEDEDKDSQNERYIAIAEVYVLDSESNMEVRQKYHIRLVYNDNRYYISDFDIRTGNLEELQNMEEE